MVIVKEKSSSSRSQESLSPLAGKIIAKELSAKASDYILKGCSVDDALRLTIIDLSLMADMWTNMFPDASRATQVRVTRALDTLRKSIK
jgi:hypothetical protein